MWIKVTKLDIKRGVPRSTEYCPIARAARRATGRRNISVGKGSCTLGKQGYDMPGNAASFIARFDGGFAVKPISFQIRKSA